MNSATAGSGGVGGTGTPWLGGQSLVHSPAIGVQEERASRVVVAVRVACDFFLRVRVSDVHIKRTRTRLNPRSVRSAAECARDTQI